MRVRRHESPVRTACCRVPELPLAAELRANPELEGRPLVLASKPGPRAELVGGGQRLAFCRADGAWSYCGLGERFDGLKLKAVRDLTTVQENVEAYR